MIWTGPLVTRIYKFPNQGDTAILMKKGKPRHTGMPQWSSHQEEQIIQGSAHHALEMSVYVDRHHRPRTRWQRAPRARLHPQDLSPSSAPRDAHSVALTQEGLCSVSGAGPWRLLKAITLGKWMGRKVGLLSGGGGLRQVWPEFAIWDLQPKERTHVHSSSLLHTHTWTHACTHTHTYTQEKVKQKFSIADKDKTR